jgi:hypothetical protein
MKFFQKLSKVHAPIVAYYIVVAHIGTIWCATKQQIFLYPLLSDLLEMKEHNSVFSSAYYFLQNFPEDARCMMPE